MTSTPGPDEADESRTALSTQIGRRLQQIREADGASLATLSERSGVGRATLSKVERGTRNPTLDTLSRASEALGVPLRSLLEESGPDQLTDVQALTQGAAVERLGCWDTAKDRVEVFRLRIAPGTRRLPPGRPGTRGYLTVVQGTMRAGSAATPRTVGPGHQIAFAADQPHVLEPVGGPAECVLIMRHELPTPEELADS
ncbi:helix-turn-helix domain-containing protein [Gephyromycinifex aptenodytis]|uniref:helix-turn-helix domain-containing protein n=1 Tax=Gephyromycinifex aptenodytis TaxID=2716227 RepID=UPI001447AA1A|nr:helix-turn-helix domain-containing protein [Gephyromycinifex aptenodytis]